MDTSEKINRNAFYPLADYHRLNTFSALELGKRKAEERVMAKWDGQPRRRPRAGEWYLSGSIIEAYRASNDLSVPFYIAKLYRVETILRESTRIIGEIQ